MAFVFWDSFSSVEDYSLLSCEDDEAVSSESSYEGQSCLSSEVDTPGGES